ncbi:tRNA uridine(34) 5-carboxymethylaminomethyl modification radical SAM/GNAT enzyme Elp3 [Candidatus Woesearchaeota archaeon]|nr:tRNA uridine(34) 5-carboxymethylaminomethyl modification radical SAM/GNAT enzyme Elp3 [Candidatus Woesearchaeota archaeon]
MIYGELISVLKKKKLNAKELYQLKRELCKKHGVKKIPTDIDVLLHASSSDAGKLGLVTKPVRTISGVAVVAVMSHPFSCKHGKCLMCPGGPASAFGDVPQSYTGNEPATMRGIRNKYDAYMQVFNRLEHYISMGHTPEKIELIVMGGTFPSFSKRYQESFITYCFKAMNDFSGLFFKNNRFDFAKFKKFFELPGDIYDEKRKKNIEKKLRKIKGKSSLEQEQIKNEKSQIKCVGLTIETRADYGKLKHANEMLKFGCTRIELGVQSVYEKSLKKIQRGHTVKETIESIRILKDLGFKINAHYMLGLPGVNEKEDLEGLRELFRNPDFRPDMLKIYPCMVIKGTKLYDLWRTGKYKPLTTEKAVRILIEFKKKVPEYLRIMRIQRDIPTKIASAGVDMNNLRQYVHQIMKKKEIKCRCIRCREVGAEKSGTPRIIIRDYEASKGREFFISAEADDKILGFCRMRFPSQSLRKEITKDSALIRELHVYGPAAGIGKKGAVQHKGIGKGLLMTAEQICKEAQKNKIIIISGIGVRDYYRKLSYKKQGPYMAKVI